MKFTCPFDHTWKGFIFGTVILALCLSVLLVLPFAFILLTAFPEMSSNVMAGIMGGVAGGLLVISLRVAKPYWDWADRVMGKLFTGSGGCGEKA